MERQDSNNWRRICILQSVRVSPADLWNFIFARHLSFCYYVTWKSPSVWLAVGSNRRYLWMCSRVWQRSMYISGNSFASGTGVLHRIFNRSGSTKLWRTEKPMPCSTQFFIPWLFSRVDCTALKPRWGPTLLSSWHGFENVERILQVRSFTLTQNVESPLVYWNIGVVCNFRDLSGAITDHWSIRHPAVLYFVTSR